MEYRRRIVDDVLDGLLTELPAIALQGPRGVGKTAIAEPLTVAASLASSC